MNNNSSNQSKSIITMTTKKTEVTVWIYGTGRAQISWGDGKSETFEFEGSKDFWGYYQNRIKYTYSDSSAHTITIEGDFISSLNCTDNDLTDLDVTKSKDLKSLNCSSNQLTNLDLSKNSRLWELNCARNQLAKLDLTHNTELSDVYCGNNLLTDAALNSLFESLHTNSVQGRYPYDENEKTIYIGDNTGTNTCDRTIIERKFWDVID